MELIIQWKTKPNFKSIPKAGLGLFEATPYDAAVETSLPGTEGGGVVQLGPPVPPVQGIHAARLTNTSKVHVEQGDGQQGPTKLSPMTPQTKQKFFVQWKVLVTSAISLEPKDTAFVGRIQIGQKRPTGCLQPAYTASGIDSFNRYQFVELLFH